VKAKDVSQHRNLRLGGLLGQPVRLTGRRWTMGKLQYDYVSLPPWVVRKGRGSPNQSGSTTSDNAGSVTTAKLAGSAQRMAIYKLE